MYISTHSTGERERERVKRGEWSSGNSLRYSTFFALLLSIKNGIPPPLRVLIRSANNELAPGRRVRPIPLDRAGCTEKGAPRTTFARKFDKAERGIRAHSCMHTLHASKGDRLCCDTSVKYRSR